MRCRDCVVGAFGVCAGDYCAAERAGLVEQAQAAAGSLGHALADFAQRRGFTIWEARCTLCGALAAITLDPQAGEPDVYGLAVSAPCPGSQHPPG